ncbi:hypothetical protein CMK11_08080 [Candidatus Poribacteria bacterium]|nr:hypothetical protein [Candidatus Poribacteria bacterium]
MISLRQDALVFSFPNLPDHATLTMDFHRTLRIPDDGDDYPLPPGLGSFPLRHTDRYLTKAPASWARTGGVMLPMYQSEAMWLSFDGSYVGDRCVEYPFAVRVATGKVDAVTGADCADALSSEPQNYMVSTEQPWLDGYCVEEGFVRQFVAMPLGAGYTAEEQVTGEAKHGGLQIEVIPMKRAAFDRLFPAVPRRTRGDQEEGAVACCAMSAEMGLAPGGRMRQEIYEDPFDLTDWDCGSASRCHVHIANSLVWRAITGDAPPTVPATSREYTDAGLPWFDYFSDTPAVPGAKTLGNLTSVAEFGKAVGDVPLPEDESVTPDHVIALRAGMSRDQVRETRF